MKRRRRHTGLLPAAKQEKMHWCTQVAINRLSGELMDWAFIRIPVITLPNSVTDTTLADSSSVHQSSITRKAIAWKMLSSQLVIDFPASSTIHPLSSTYLLEIASLSLLTAPANAIWRDWMQYILFFALCDGYVPVIASSLGRNRIDSDAGCSLLSSYQQIKFKSGVSNFFLFHSLRF